MNGKADLDEVEAARGRPKYSCKFGVLSHDVLADPDLSPSAKLILLALQRWGYGKDYCFPKVATLASATGLSERTVQASCKKLEARGFIRIDDDPANRTGRRIVRLWMQDPTLHPIRERPSPLGADSAPPRRKSCAPALGADSAPKRTTLSERSDMAAACAPNSQPLPPLFSSPTPEIQKDITRSSIDAAELEALINRVAEVYRFKADAARPKVTHLLGQYRFAWVAVAIENVAHVARTKSVGWGLFIKILNDYQKEGGPPPYRRPKMDAPDYLPPIEYIERLPPHPKRKYDEPKPPVLPELKPIKRDNPWKY